MRRNGFSLLEVLIALVVTSVGALALQSVSTALARLSNDGRERRRVAQALDSRLEWLADQVRQSGFCLAPSPGSATWPGGGGESWSATAWSRGIEFRVIAWTARRAMSPDSAVGGTPCP